MYGVCRGRFEVVIMIYSLTGKIIKKTLNAVVICCGGVGYYAQCAACVAGALPGVVY